MAKRYSGPPAMQIDPAKRYAATFHTSRGDFTAELLAAHGDLDPVRVLVRLAGRAKVADQVMDRREVSDDANRESHDG